MEEAKQLEFNFDTNDIMERVDESTTEDKKTVEDRKCDEGRHSVIFKALKGDYVTYCDKCGEILSVRHKARRRKKGDPEKC